MKKTPDYIYNILSKVYKEIYFKISNKTIHCFLCGARKSVNGDSKTLRDFLKVFLDESGVKVLFAEQLFKNLVDAKNEHNFLQLENILADNADIVIIVLESEGAFVELGAFSNSEQLKEKLIVLMDKCYRNDESFINLGPIKLLKSLRRKSVIYYDQTIEPSVATEVRKSIHDYLADKELEHTNNLSSIITLYYFLQIYFCYFSPVTFKEIIDHISYVSGTIDPDLSVKVRSALKLLYEDDIAKKEKKKFYVLTEKGFDRVRGVISENKIKFEDRFLLDKLRLAVLNQKLRLQRDNYKEYYC